MYSDSKGSPFDSMVHPAGCQEALPLEPSNPSEREMPEAASWGFTFFAAIGLMAWARLVMMRLVVMPLWVCTTWSFTSLARDLLLSTFTSAESFAVVTCERASLFTRCVFADKLGWAYIDAAQPIANTESKNAFIGKKYLKINEKKTCFLDRMIFVFILEFPASSHCLIAVATFGVKNLFMPQS